MYPAQQQPVADWWLPNRMTQKRGRALIWIMITKKDKVRITQLEEINYGLEKNKVVIFDSLPDENGQYPGPPPSKWGDTIEFVLTSGEAGAFVRVVQNP